VLRLISTFVLVLFAFNLNAQTQVEDEMGIFKIDGEPQRIVVLEYSFVDALAALDISPVGIADDGQADSVIAQVRERISPWVSVGSRSTPSLEIISSLKPDMIIADFERHQAIYDDLKKIAPTLILKSKGESYEDNLISVAKIGKALNQEEKTLARLKEHNKRMDTFAENINSDHTFLFGVASSRGFTMHSPKAYAGSVMSRLGLKSAIAQEQDKAYISATLERLLKANPDYLLVGKYGEKTVVDNFEKSPLWPLISAVKNKTYTQTNPFLWSKNRGVIAAEIMAAELQLLIK
jgi:iron complex transport system substrate-binding protein